MTDCTQSSRAKSQFGRIALRLLVTLGPLWAILAAFAVGAILISAIALDPREAYAAMIKGAFGTLRSFGVTVQKMAPLLLAGLGVAIAFRAGIFNVGAEGQLFIGALFATLAAFFIPGLPAVLHVPICLLAGALGGALWSAVPGWLKVRYGVNELIMTIMFNYIAIYIVSAVCNGPLKEDADYTPQTNLLPASSELPTIWPKANIHLGIVVALAVALLVYLLMKYTTFGFQLRATGTNLTAARFSGIPAGRVRMTAMLLSGALAGLAGTCELLGAQHRLSVYLSPGYGYDAIGVALLFGESAAGVTLAALFFGALRAGLNAVQRSIGLPTALSQVLQGTVIFFVVTSRAFSLGQVRIGRRRKQREEVAAG